MVVKFSYFESGRAIHVELARPVRTTLGCYSRVTDRSIGTKATDKRRRRNHIAT
jgi:hypothetical protein